MLWGKDETVRRGTKRASCLWWEECSLHLPSPLLGVHVATAIHRVAVAVHSGWGRGTGPPRSVLCSDLHPQVLALYVLGYRECASQDENKGFQEFTRTKYLLEKFGKCEEFEIIFEKWEPC